MGKLTDKYTAELRAAMAERERLIKLFGEQSGLKDAQERVRQFGEKLDLTQLAETLKAETAAPPPHEPTPPQRRRGRKRSISPEKTEEGIRILRDKPNMSVKAARATLRAAGIEGEDGPLYRLIIKPAYDVMSK